MDLDLVQHFAGLLSEAYRRYVDLVEIQRTEIQRQVLHRVRERVWALETDADIPALLEVVRQGLVELQVPFDGCGVNIVDDAVDPPVVYSHNKQAQGEWLEAGEEQGRDFVLEFWRAGEVAYRRDLLGEDSRGEQRHIAELFATPVRSVLDVPFSCGTLAVNSAQANAFSAMDIDNLRLIVDSIDSGFRRAEDLRKLVARNVELEDKDRLLTAFHRLGLRALASLEMEQVLDDLVEQIPAAGIFRSLMIALVDEERHQIAVVRNMTLRGSGGRLLSEPEVVPEINGLVYDLDDDNITAVVARTGQLQVIDEWDERFDPRVDQLGSRRGQASYFIPVKSGQRVLAVLATGSELAEKAEMLVRIEHMQPLLDQVALTLEHALLYRKSQQQAAHLASAVDHLRQEIGQRQQVETELRKAHSELSQVEEEFRALAENLPDIVVRLDRQYRVLYMNPAIEELMGLPVAHFIGKTGLEMGFPRDLILRWSAALEGVFGLGVEQLLDFELDTPQGHRYLQARFAAEAGGQTVVAVVRDLTESRQLEQKFVRLERMRALGELAAGVSHNLNNILTGVLAPAQLIRRLTDNAEVLNEARHIESAAKRARDVVARMSRSVHGDEESMQPVQVEEVVRDVVQATRPRWQDEAQSQGIDIEVAIDMGAAEKVPVIRGTPTGLYEMLVNLLINAVEAMPTGGVIDVAVATGETEVLIRVRDSGAGMDEETRRRLFEPFFTTKSTVGTGLGLSTLYGMLVSWGGEVDVESAPGQGTVFTLRLQTWTDPLPIEQIAPSPDLLRTRILVVDDEQITRRALNGLLGQDHALELAANGFEALESFEPGRFELAILDLGMPGMAGDQLSRELKRIDPELITAVFTGWHLANEDPRRAAFDLYLQKPAGGPEIFRCIADAWELRNGNDDRVN